MVGLHICNCEPCAGWHHLRSLWTSRRTQTIPPRAVGAPGSPDPTTTSPGCRGVFPDPVQIPHAPKHMLVIPRIHTATPGVPRTSLTRRPENRLKRPYNLRQPMPPGSAPFVAASASGPGEASPLSLSPSGIPVVELLLSQTFPRVQSHSRAHRSPQSPRVAVGLSVRPWCARVAHAPRLVYSPPMAAIRRVSSSMSTSSTWQAIDHTLPDGSATRAIRSP